MTTVDGRVTAVMETWPLQLTVTTADGRAVAVSLAPGTAITRQGAAVDAGRIRVGARVTIEGEPLAGDAVRASVVVLLQD